MALVRRANINDVTDIGVIAVLSWQAAYRGLMPDEFLNGLDLNKRTNGFRELVQNPDITILVVNDDDDNVVGYSILNTSRDADAPPATGEIGAIYVHPGKWKRGFGGTLLSESIEHARERGFGELTLWVLEANERARGFYEYFGFTADDNLKEVKRPEGFIMREVRYRLNLKATR
jgi:ribosomal protein S18 acetylase RimI-like enzyme